MTIRLYADKTGKKETFIKIDREAPDKFWFNIINQDGATEEHPYGYTTRERLEHLQEELKNLLK